MGSRYNLPSSIHLSLLSFRNCLRSVARDHVWLNPDLYIDPGDQCGYSLIQRSMSAFLSFSRGVPALLTRVGRGHKEQGCPAGLCGAEASTADHVCFSWCSGDCTLFFEAGYEVGIVKWGKGKLKVMERTPAGQEIQESLTAGLALEAGCSWCLQVPVPFSPALGHPSVFPTEETEGSVEKLQPASIRFNL